MVWGCLLRLWRFSPNIQPHFLTIIVLFCFCFFKYNFIPLMKPLIHKYYFLWRDSQQPKTQSNNELKCTKRRRNKIKTSQHKQQTNTHNKIQNQITALTMHPLMLSCPADCGGGLHHQENNKYQLHFHLCEELLRDSSNSIRLNPVFYLCSALHSEVRTWQYYTGRPSSSNWAALCKETESAQFDGPVLSFLLHLLISSRIRLNDKLHVDSSFLLPSPPWAT